MLTRNGTLGRVYGGDPNLVHIADGQRYDMGVRVSNYLDAQMRADAARSKARTQWQADRQPLCPGCVMVALFNASVVTAVANGQPRRELAATMRRAFDKLTDVATHNVAFEEIAVILDPE